MKAILPILLIVIIIGAILYFTSNKKSEEKVMENEKDLAGEDISSETEGEFTFDKEESSAKWTGSKKIIKDYYDSGSIMIQSGNVSFENGMVTKGEIVFDMTSITGEESSNTKIPVSSLTDHLKSDDFFEISNYPTATYVVTSSEKTEDGYMLMGDLTLKGKTNPLNVPVKSAMQEGNVVMTGSAKVDRSKWDVKYGSDSFFDNLGDNVINDIFTLEFKIVAKK